ncbi:MAG: hypothetical protein ACTHME_06245 [Candidatus Nitrosocosmicus sp.]
MSDEAMKLVLRNLPMKDRDKMNLLISYMKQKYYGDFETIDTEQYQKLIQLSETFLSRMKEDERKEIDELI